MKLLMNYILLVKSLLLSVLVMKLNDFCYCKKCFSSEKIVYCKNNFFKKKLNKFLKR